MNKNRALKLKQTSNISVQYNPIYVLSLYWINARSSPTESVELIVQLSFNNISRRFGVDKSTAKLGSKTLLEHTIEIINDKFSEIIVVSNNNIKLNSKKIIKINDCIVGQLGPLVGVLSAMKWVKENKKKYSWIATFPCDTPYFKNTVVDEMIQCSKIKDSRLFFFKK